MRTSLKVLGTLLLASCTMSILAQGTLFFRNNDLSLVTQPISLTERGPINVPKGGGFVHIAYAPTGTPLKSSLWGSAGPSEADWLDNNPGWTFTDAVGFNAPGKFDGGTIELAGIPAGSSVDYFMVGWTGFIPSFDAALASGSPVLFGWNLQQFGTSTGGGNTPPIPLADSSTGLALFYPPDYIPEPSGIALFAAGAVCALLFRRRT